MCAIVPHIKTATFLLSISESENAVVHLCIVTMPCHILCHFIVYFYMSIVRTLALRPWHRQAAATMVLLGRFLMEDVSKGFAFKRIIEIHIKIYIKNILFLGPVFFILARINFT